MDSLPPVNVLRAVDAEAITPIASITSRSKEANASDDSALMLRYRNGEVRAFEILYLRHKGPLYRYLQRMCRNREAVNDLFQEVWSKVIATRDRYEARAQFSTFLFRIGHNSAVDYFRLASRQHIGRTEDVDDLHDVLPSDDVHRPDILLSESQLREAFKAALDRLPDEQRNVFVLFEETGLTLEEISTVTGVSFETTKSRLRYALNKLRVSLKHYRPATASDQTS